MIMALISYKPDSVYSPYSPHDDRRTASLGLNHASNNQQQQ